jgi:hypothetical protein
MARQTRLIQCAIQARQLDQGPHLRISIRASGERMPHKQAGHMKATDHRNTTKPALAKGASTYESIAHL